MDFKKNFSDNSDNAAYVHFFFVKTPEAILKLISIYFKDVSSYLTKYENIYFQN